MRKTLRRLALLVGVVALATAPVSTASAASASSSDGCTLKVSTGAITICI